jgi:hypothetical protein
MGEPSTKRFLGYTLRKDPKINMWTSDTELDEVSITINQHSAESWSVAATLGGPSLFGMGKTEQSARADIIKRMRDVKKLLGYFKV